MTIQALRAGKSSRNLPENLPIFEMYSNGKPLGFLTA